MGMTPESASESITFSVAPDVGNIELLHARVERRGLAPHWHEEYSVSVSLRGGLAFDFRGSRHSAQSGIISCIPPGEVHNAYAATGECWEFVSFLVPAAAVREILNGIECADPLPGFGDRLVSDTGTAARLISLHNLLAGSGDLLDRQSASLAVLGDFFRRHSTLRRHMRAPQREHECIRRVREYLHDRYADPIPLSALASHAGLSPYYFLRTFRAAMGMTPHAYLNQIRLAEAKRRLAGGAPASEAALACGFYDQSHMTRQFKRSSFVTPGKYIRAHHSSNRSLSAAR